MLMTLFILLVFFSIPQVHDVVPFNFNLEIISFYWFDLLTVGAFSYWIGQALFTKNTDSGFLLRINKVYLLFLLLGLIPIFIGFMKGKGNLLSSYRFFFYFVWIPVIVQLLQKPKRAMTSVTWLVNINMVSVLLALFTHFWTYGLQIGYLSNYRELNVVVSMIMLSFFLAKRSLVGKKADILIFTVCILAVIFDQSRKIYIALLVGGGILLVNYMNIYEKKIKIDRRIVSIVLLLLIIITVSGLGDTIIDRLKTMIVTPSQLQELDVDPSAFFRIHALIGGLNLIIEHPVIGLGAGDAIEIQQWIVSKFGLTTTRSPHNFYISAMLYYGIPIVLLVYYMIFKLIRASLSKLQSNALPLLTKQKIISLGLIAGFIAFMTEIFFEGFEVETIVSTWLFFGLMLGFTELHLKMIKKI